MKFDDIISQDVSSLYNLRDDVATEMVEATGKKLATLQVKLVAIEEAITLKESGYEHKETQEA